MPLFEYDCDECRKPFEILIRGQEAPACPICSGTRLTKRLSVFSVGGQGKTLAAREPAGPCGSCGDPRGPGSCAMD